MFYFISFEREERGRWSGRGNDCKRLKRKFMNVHWGKGFNLKFPQRNIVCVSFLRPFKIQGSNANPQSYTCVSVWQTFCSHTNTMLYVCVCVSLSCNVFFWANCIHSLQKLLNFVVLFCASSTFLLMFCTEGNTILPETRRENWWTDRYKVQVGLHFDTYFFEFKDPYIYCRISNWQNETRQNTTNIFKILFLVDCVSLQVHDFIQRISFGWEEEEKSAK